MPYVSTATPSSSTATSSSSSTTMTSLATPPPSRPGHRRTRSAFTDEKIGPGAFAPLPALPRRRAAQGSAIKKAVFHISGDDESPPEQDSPPASPPANGLHTPSSSPTNSLRLSIDTPSYIKLPERRIDTSYSTLSAGVPFPTSSPTSANGEYVSPFGPPSPSHSSTLSRTPSTPIILSTGKPLKSSLKSSSSSPNVAGEFAEGHRKHLRAQSAPSTPRVHFAEKDAGLEMVRVFKKSGKPASVSRPAGEETETETEAESYPFPILSSSSSSSFASSFSSAGSSAVKSQQLLHEIDTSPDASSIIPNPQPSPTANIHVETITLPRTRPPTLRGTVLTRNLCFEKNVVVRFTLDDWQTTSEVTCKHVVSLPGLPPPFPRAKKTIGDVAASIANGEPVEAEDANKPTWDRFSFTIRLEDYEPKLSERTLYLVARFGSPCGEFWDNNNGANYCVRFRCAVASPLASPRMPSTIANTLFGTNLQSQQRTFNPPSSMKLTPTTGAATVISRVAVGGEGSGKVSPPADESESEKTPIEQDVDGVVKGQRIVSPAPIPIIRRHSSPQSLLTNKAPSFSPAPPRSKPSQHEHVHFNTVPASASPAQKFFQRRLSLSNYVAPSTTPKAEKDVVGGMATPPITPPKEASLKDLPEVKGSGELSPVKLSPLVIIGGMPATAPPSSSPQPSSNSSSSSSLSSIGSAISSLYGDDPYASKSSPLAESDDLPLPFSPTSKRSSPFSKMSSLGSQLVLNQLASPPASRNGSEESTPASSRRSSPPPSSLGTDSGSRHESPTRLELPPLEDAFANDVRKLDHSPQFSESQVTTPTPQSVAATQDQGPVQVPGADGKVDTSDSSYTAFVRQWCFAQSTPPAPGVTDNGSPGSIGSASATPVPVSIRPNVSPPSTSYNGSTFGFGAVGMGVPYGSPYGGAPVYNSQPQVGPPRQQAWSAEHQIGAGTAMGLGNGYGFPGFGFGAAKNGPHHEGSMIGAQMH